VLDRYHHKHTHKQSHCPSLLIQFKDWMLKACSELRTVTVVGKRKVT